MHIGFLSSEYPHVKLNRTGGLGTSIKNLAKELTKKGITVSVFVYGQDKNEEFKDEGITIYKIAQKKYPFLGWYLYRKHINAYIDRIIVAHNIDVIEAPDWTGITAFMKFKCPHIIRLHGSDAYFCDLENRKQKFKNYFFEKKALLGADKIISVSSFTAKKTNEIFNINKCNEVIHNGINTDNFKPLDISINENQLLYFGTIIRKKGVLELAHVFNLLVEKQPNATLLLLGKDVVDIFEQKSTLELFFNILSAKAKVNVTHLKEVDYAEVANIIAQANVITLPSFAEAFPMTWLEAMAMEKALVTSDIGWAKEMMINGETGFAISPKDHKDYANKIQLLLTDTILAKQCGKYAREFVLENFDAQLVVEQNIVFYKLISHKV